MKILLINNNPVVSRLTALSARKEDIEIDEIQEVTELTSYNYDIIFVDADSWNEDVKSTIFSHIETQKKVLFYAQDDNEDLDLFDKGILKPFLPSEVSAVIRSVEENSTLDNISNEIEEEKSIDLIDHSKESSAPEAIGLGSVAAVASVNTDLMDELTKGNKEKVEETLLSSADLDEELFKETSEELNINVNDFTLESSKEKLFELDSDEKTSSLDDDLFKADELLELDLDKDSELNLDNENLFDSKLKVEESNKEDVLEELNGVATEPKSKIETKILDVEEISTIKEILEDDIPNDTMELDDLVVPGMMGVAAMSLDSKKETEEKKSEEEKKTFVKSSEFADGLVDTLSSLKVESLKELLAGATITISIQFPKA